MLPFHLESLWRVLLLRSLYFTVCKNRYTHSLIIPQYSVGSSAVKNAKCDSSLFKFFVEQFGNAVAIWLVTGQGFQNTKWPVVLYSQ